MLDYIIKVLLFQTLFLVVYDLFLKRETFFQWNRVYLMATSVLAYVIPLVKIDRVQQIIPQEYVVLLPEVFLNPSTVIKEQLGQPITLFFVLKVFFWLGIAVASVLFLVKLYKIVRLIIANDKEFTSSYYLVWLQNNKAFSFFNYIFLGKESNNKAQIIEHELVHVQQKHSLDLLFFELQKIVFWFNPYSYLYQARISELHEFIADSKAIKTENKTTYFNNLLSESFGVQNISFVNPCFKHSLLKKRIVMLNKNKSKQILKFKYALLIPLTVVMFMIASNSIAQENDNLYNKENTYKLSLVKESPVYPNCDKLKDQFNIRTCLSESITKHFEDNFDFTLLKELDTKNGKRHIYTMFIIDESGNIAAPHTFSRERNENLEKEALRVVKLLPQMTPGVRKGKPVSVSYGVSINYSNDDLIIKSGSGPY